MGNLDWMSHWNSFSHRLVRGQIPYLSVYLNQTVYEMSILLMEVLIMSNDTRQLLHELELTLLTMLPNTDSIKLKLRFEEIIQNYEITRKTAENLENDLQEKIELYLNAVTVEGFSISTIMNYNEELRLFSNHLLKPAALITTTGIRNYLALNPNLKNSTIAKKLSVIKAFFAWLVREELLLHNPALKIRPLKQESRLPKSLTPMEMETVRNACLTLRERAFVEIFFLRVVDFLKSVE